MKKKYTYFTYLIFLFTSISYAQFGISQLIDHQTFQISKVHASDLDGDGDMDVLILGQNANTVAWYENLDGLGTFGAINYVSQTLNFTQSLGTADFDGDGDMDILASSTGDDNVVWFKNIDGIGNFSNQLIIDNDAPFVREIVAADIDNDDDLDVVAALQGVSDVVWYENTDGLGDFSDKKIITSFATNVYQIDVADLNGDESMDVLTNSSTIGFPSWFENLDGQGNFGTEHIIDFDGTFQVLASDIDNDGDIDIFKRELLGEDNLLTWLENTDGLGTFEHRQIISNIYQGRYMAAADMDNDDDIDLLTTYVGDGAIAWFENLDGDGTFGERQIIDAFASTSIVGVDIDGDGYKDVLTQIENFKVVWYKNLMFIGVEEFSKESIILLPNPVSNILTIDNTSITQITSIKIYDVLGRLVLQEKEQFNTIDVSHLTSGLLFVKIETEQGSITKKVVKE